MAAGTPEAVSVDSPRIAPDHEAPRADTMADAPQAEAPKAETSKVEAPKIETVLIDRPTERSLGAGEPMGFRPLCLSGIMQHA